MTTTPTTREGYKAAILHNIYRLVQALELDDDSGYPEGIARNIHHDTREYFSRDRWKPTPIFEGIQARIPQEEVLTFCFQYWEPETAEDVQRAIVWVTGRVTTIEKLYKPDDGARFYIVPTRKRNPQHFRYRAGYETSLKVWRGKLTPEQAQAREPFYQHSTQPQEAAV